MELYDREWNKYFIAGDKGFSQINSTSSGIDKNKLNFSDCNETPYITRTETNNGVNLFVSEEQAKKYKKDYGNRITIGLDTQTVFYQEKDFFTGQNIQVMKYPNINKRNALFIIPLIKVQMQKFSWGGNGATLGRLARTSIMLPETIEGNIDGVFMEKYTKSKIENKLEKYKKYALKTLSNIEYKDIPELNEMEYDIFRIGDLFDLRQGKSKGLNHLNELKEGVSYLGATNQNNGVLTYVEVSKENYKMIQKGNCIAFIRNGKWLRRILCL